MNYLERRIYETLQYHMVFSIIFAGLFYFGVFPQSYRVSVAMLCLCAIIDIVLVIFFSSIYYRYSEEELAVCYKTNLLALTTLIGPAILFALIDLVVSIEPIYTFLFFPFKLGMIAVGMTKLCSAITFSALLIIIVLLIPLFVRKVIMTEEPLPPIMELESDKEENIKKVSE